MLWGELAAENPELADQSAGIEGVHAAGRWGWCAICGKDVPQVAAHMRSKHSRGGTVRSGGGGGEVNLKAAIVYVAMLVALFGFLDYMADKSAP